MKPPVISIVIPSYNKVKYIGKTLESIVSQSYKYFEVIIQDGGSTDGSLEIIKKYANKYSKFIKYVSIKDNGQLDAINEGIKKTKGELITFINSDDVYTEGAFESVVGYYIENQKAMWFAGKGMVIDEKGIEIAKIVTYYKNILLHSNSYFNLLVTNYLMQPSVFLTRETINKYGLFTGTKFSVMEYDMWLKIGKDEMPVVINKVLSKFRLYGDSKTGSYFRIILKDDEKIVEKYSSNIFILVLHKMQNIGRMIYERIY